MTLDAGALIAFERNQRDVVAVVARAQETGDLLAVPAGVLAQVWRDGSRQPRLVRLLASPLVEVVALDDYTARAAGQLCGVAGADDVVDVSVVLCARQRGHRVLTGDPADLRSIDSHLPLHRI